MGISFKFGKVSPLLEDERVLHRQRTFWAISSLCAPNYRIGIQLPLLSFYTLIVTNRRVRVITNMFFFLNQTVDLWFPGNAPEGETEEILSVSSGDAYLGKILEIKSYDPKRADSTKWSPGLTLRFYFKDAKKVAELVRDNIDNDALDSEQTHRRLEEMSLDTPRMAMGQKVPWAYALLAILSFLLSLVCIVGAGLVDSTSLRISLFSLFFLFMAGHVWAILAGVWAGRRKVLETRKRP